MLQPVLLPSPMTICPVPNWLFRLGAGLRIHPKLHQAVEHRKMFPPAIAIQCQGQSEFQCLYPWVIMEDIPVGLACQGLVVTYLTSSMRCNIHCSNKKQVKSSSFFCSSVAKCLQELLLVRFFPSHGLAIQESNTALYFH